MVTFVHSLFLLVRDVFKNSLDKAAASSYRIWAMRSIGA